MTKERFGADSTEFDEDRAPDWTSRLPLSFGKERGGVTCTTLRRLLGPHLE